MTKQLEKAFSEVSKLPAKDQDAIAEIVLAELASEQRWNYRAVGILEGFAINLGQHGWWNAFSSSYLGIDLIR